jgi:RNA polymerase sigma factor (sigma-70 family)
MRAEALPEVDVPARRRSPLTFEGEVELGTRMTSASAAILRTMCSFGVRAPELEARAHAASRRDGLDAVVHKSLRYVSDVEPVRALVAKEAALQRRLAAMLECSSSSRLGRAEVLAAKRLEVLEELALERRFIRQTARAFVRATSGRAWADRDVIEATYGRPLEALREAAVPMRQQLEALDGAVCELVEANLGLACSLARCHRHRGIPVEDLVQEAYIGLIRAADRYDHRRGYRFSTYASWWIKQGVHACLRNHARTVRIPANVQDVVHQMARTEQRLQGELQRRPTLDEVAESVGLSRGKARLAALARRRVLSIHAPPRDDSTLLLEDTLAAPAVEGPEAAALDADLRAVARGLLDSLPPRQRLILSRRYGFDDEDPQTLAAIGSVLGLTRERVRQIEAESLRRLRLEPLAGAIVDLIHD